MLGRFLELDLKRPLLEIIAIEKLLNCAVSSICSEHSTQDYYVYKTT